MTASRSEINRAKRYFRRMTGYQREAAELLAKYLAPLSVQRSRTRIHWWYARLATSDVAERLRYYGEPA